MFTVPSGFKLLSTNSVLLFVIIYRENGMDNANMILEHHEFYIKMWSTTNRSMKP